MGRKSKWYSALIPLATLALGTLLAQGGSTLLGDLVGGPGVTVGGSNALPHTTLYSGDSVKVAQGVAEVTFTERNRVVLKSSTEASFAKDPRGVTVTLDRGSLSLYQPENAAALRLKVESLDILPAANFKTVGDVAALGNTLQVTTHMGSLRLVGPQGSVDVAAGKTITVQRVEAGAAGAAASHMKLARNLVVTSLGATGTGLALKPKNPIAISNVGAHVPPQACQNAASPSVPAAACP